MQRPPTAGEATVRLRAERALRARHNWVQLAKFCTVGASGYVVNLAVYTALLHWAGLHYLPPAAPRLPGTSLLRRLAGRARREPRLSAPPRRARARQDSRAGDCDRPGH